MQLVRDGLQTASGAFPEDDAEPRPPPLLPVTSLNQVRDES